MHVGLGLSSPGIRGLKIPGEMLEPPGDDPNKDDDLGIDPTLPIDDDPGNVDPTLPITDDPGIEEPTLPITDDPGIVDPTLPITDDPGIEEPTLPITDDVPGSGALPNMNGRGPVPNAWPGLAPKVPNVPKGAAKLRGAAASSAAATTDRMY
jgi:hypothetical protein